MQSTILQTYMQYFEADTDTTGLVILDHEEHVHYVALDEIKALFESFENETLECLDLETSVICGTYTLLIRQAIEEQALDAINHAIGEIKHLRSCQNVHIKTVFLDPSDPHILDFVGPLNHYIKAIHTYKETRR